jgi:hypothetical protein
MTTLSLALVVLCGTLLKGQKQAEKKAGRILTLASTSLEVR